MQPVQEVEKHVPVREGDYVSFDGLTGEIHTCQLFVAAIRVIEQQPLGADIT